MLRTLFGLRARKSVVLAAAAALLLAAALPGGALGAGPDAPPPSSSVKTGAAGGPGSGGAPPGGAPDTADSNIRWDIFEGHAFADGRLSATGLPLIACLGGCDDGYVSEPVLIGVEGRYHGLKVGRPASAQPVGDASDAITFWLVGVDDRVNAHQAVLFQGESATRPLDLSFDAMPGIGADDAENAAANGNGNVAGDAGLDSGTAAGYGYAGAGADADFAATGDWRTTDLTLPDAADLGLVPANSAAGFAANTFRYQGIPLLPGLVTALGLTIAGVGVSLLMYRRRITW